jgi:hypothetical protein
MNETNEANEMMLDSVIDGEMSTFEENEELAKEALDIEESVLEESDEEGEDIDETDELSRLRTELEELRARLAEKEELEKASLRMRQELTEFGEYFPEVELESIPEEVWDKVKGGASLSAQYSLYRRRVELEKRRISDFNEKNRKMSAGAAGRADGEKYYSPSEVKRMSPSQVKAHYNEIVESMRHWN